MSDTFAHDEKLRQIYLKFREVCKRHDNGIGISQASADVRIEPTSPMLMENSKTGAAGRLDYVGKQDITDHNDTRRYLTISKNKLTGFHGNIVCNLETDTSRYTA